MHVRDVIAAIDRLAPFSLAEPWDHVGLQVGAPGDELPLVGGPAASGIAARPGVGGAVAGRGAAEGAAAETVAAENAAAEGAATRPDAAATSATPVILVALEVDDAVLDEARRIGASVIVSHHPLIHDPLERLSDDTQAGRLALRAAREGVAVIAAHTNLDKARGGMADIVAELLGLRDVAPLAPAPADVLKLVGFVPDDDVDLVRKALFASGAGVIGEYEHCSWSVGGQGTFFGGEATHPAVGMSGRDETVNERRLEVVFPRRLRRRVVSAYVAAHPYEEPAFDIIPLENEVASLGLGRVGALPTATTLHALAADVKAALRLPSVRFVGDGARAIVRVAILPGSGAEAIARGVAQVADVLITGDVKYHEARLAQAQGLALIDAPHGLTEQEGMLRWADRLRNALGSAVTIVTYRNVAVAVWRESVEADEADEVDEVGNELGEVDQADEEEGNPDAAPLRQDDLTSSRRAETANRDNDRYRLYTDGGARGNPGPAGIGARLLTAEGDVVEEVADFIGTTTNNIAEYQALIAGLEIALDRGVERLDVFLDSELVVRQVNGEYKVKNDGLKPLHEQACLLLSRFHKVDVRHVRREHNAAADALVNQAIDAAAAG